MPPRVSYGDQHDLPRKPEPSLAAIVATLFFGITGLGALVGWAVWVGVRTYCGFDTLFPR